LTTGLKICSTCKESKQLDAFGNLSSAKDRLAYSCLDCTRTKMSTWRKENQSRDTANKYRWADNNREKLKEKGKKYYALNKERCKAACKNWSQRNTEKRRQSVYQWVELNRAVKNSWNAMRRAAKLNATPRWLTAIQKAQIQEMYDVSIALNVQTGINYHVDHIHPLQGDGFTGLHVPWNLQVIPALENISKSNILPLEHHDMAWERKS